MRDEKRVVTLNDYEQRLMVRGLTDFRNDALRDGKPTEPACKGCTFKGPFHVPRSLIMADQLIGQILEQN